MTTTTGADTPRMLAEQWVLTAMAEVATVAFRHGYNAGESGEVIAADNPSFVVTIDAGPNQPEWVLYQRRRLL